MMSIYDDSQKYCRECIDAVFQPFEVVQQVKGRPITEYEYNAIVNYVSFNKPSNETEAEWLGWDKATWKKFQDAGIYIHRIKKDGKSLFEDCSEEIEWTVEEIRDLFLDFLVPLMHTNAGGYNSGLENVAHPYERYKQAILQLLAVKIMALVEMMEGK